MSQQEIRENRARRWNYRTSSHHERSWRTDDWRRDDDLLSSSRAAAPPPPPRLTEFPFPLRRLVLRLSLFQAPSLPISLAGVLTASPQLHSREPHTTTTLHPYPTLSHSPSTQAPLSPQRPLSTFCRSLPLSRCAPSPTFLDDPHRSLTPRRPSSSASTPLGPPPSYPRRGRLFSHLSSPFRSLAPTCLSRSPSLSLSHSGFSRPGALVGSPSTLDPPHLGSMRWRWRRRRR